MLAIGRIKLFFK